MRQVLMVSVPASFVAHVLNEWRVGSPERATTRDRIVEAS